MYVMKKVEAGEVIEIDSSSPQGNAFFILGTVKSVMKSIGHWNEDEIAKAMEEMKSGDYEHLCKKAEEFTDGLVEVI